ncbi:MAG: CoA transferase [Planctomycetota bacterium]
MTSLHIHEVEADLSRAPGARDRPLAGLRGADFSWASAAPMSTRVLADWGATVVRIESEHRMEAIRGAGPARGRDQRPEWVSCSPRRQSTGASPPISR